LHLGRGRARARARLFPLQAIDNASLLERAVLETGADDLFETALRSAARCWDNARRHGPHQQSTVLEDPAALARAAADHVVAVLGTALAQHDVAHVALAGGSTRGR